MTSDKEQVTFSHSFHFIIFFISALNKIYCQLAVTILI
jgi:hypothetical protein